MQTLLEKWNYYASIINGREELYINETVKDVPDYVYEVWGRDANIRELKITGVKYCNRKYFSFHKKPTKGDVEAIRLFAETPYTFDIANIVYSYTETYGSGSKCSGGFNLKDIGKYMTKQEAEDKAKPIRDAYNAGRSLVDAGTHTACERCGNVVENKDVVHYKITSIATYGYAGRNGKFCSGTCASHEQFAHEG